MDRLEEDALERDAGWVREERPTPWPSVLVFLGYCALLAFLVLFLVIFWAAVLL